MLHRVILLACFACVLVQPIAAQNDVHAQALAELYANRFDNAADLYSKLAAQQPDDGSAWLGLVRANLGRHRSKEAYDAADNALKKAPKSADSQAAVGFAMYRRGKLVDAEKAFRSALRIQPGHAQALKGLAMVLSTISKYRTARDLRREAYQHAPDDPELMQFHANSLKRDEHIAALEEILAKLDPLSEQYRRIAVHIANDRAVQGRKLSRLTSPYADAQLKMELILDGPNRPRGVGLNVRLNGKENVKLLLDSGASGISISPKAAEKAGLEVMGGRSSETKGIGDQKAQLALAYLASEVRVGNVTFADHPVSVFRSAKDANFDGLIGPDVFADFLVKLDFPKLAVVLTPRPEGVDKEDAEPQDWNTPPAGFYQVFRFGDHLALPTLVNGKETALFIVDSGSSANLIDTDLARAAQGGVSEDSRIRVKGLQGSVNNVSVARRISLVFAGFKQDNPDLVAISLEKMGDSMGLGFGGLLGMPVLGHMAVTIDYRSGSIRFEYHP